MIGNKSDLDSQRKVEHHEGQTFAEENKMLFIETSAKTNSNVNEAFTLVADKILARIGKKSNQSSSADETGGIDLKTKRKDDGKCAC